MCIVMFTWDVLRSIPIVSLTGAVVALVGSSMFMADAGNLQQAFVDLHLGVAAKFCSFFTLIFIYTFLTNVFAVAVAIPTTGATRECCFGRTDSCCASFCQCFFGTCALRCAFFFVAIAFLVNFALCIVILPATGLLTIVLGACVAGPTAISGLVKSLGASSWLQGAFNQGVSTITGFCHTNILGASSVYLMGLGCVLCVLGEVILLVTITNNYVRVQLESQLITEDERVALYHSKPV